MKVTWLKVIDQVDNKLHLNRSWARHPVVSIPTCARGRSQSVADAGRGKPLGPDHLGNIGGVYLYG